MASIFTFDPDPPRVSSPWSTPRASTPIAKLEAEPQEGPTEYKLHLLLRRGRQYLSTSTASTIPGSYRSVSASLKPKSGDANFEIQPLSQTSSLRTRQQRLEQLTTQLLWRLQQSCPHHSTSANNQITPVFPNASTLDKEIEVDRVLPGLEESLGALYEIGIADDGTFVGLVEDELTESIRTLRAMAASLGCVVDIIRKVSVGTCEWFDAAKGERDVRTDELWVAEAYVKPNLSIRRSENAVRRDLDVQPTTSISAFELEDVQAPEQLSVSFTGPTMSGKSTLLGSLTTATLDNGRGKSRLNLLRHRHEIVSGMTSSITQEVMGYTQERDGTTDLVNYASDHVSSWVDIHNSCQDGRLVLLSDSAGHPRYRRTMLRSLIGWAPDWTLLCIPADVTEDTSGLVGSTPPPEEVLGVASVDVDLSQAHLELCLKLDLRLVIVVTKLDLASNAGLRQGLGRILSVLKAAGRTPKMVVNSAGATKADADLTVIPSMVYGKVGEVVASLSEERVVPIVLTSAVEGTGIPTLHALLCRLPIPNPAPMTIDQSEPRTIFHVEETYHTRINAERDNNLPVLSGLLARGRINIGDELFLGPFATDFAPNQSDPEAQDGATERPQIPTSRSFPGALNLAQGLPSPINRKEEEWVKVRINSIRHLRLPVTTLSAGQVGTIGVQPSEASKPLRILAAVRKGMVLADSSPRARRGFVAKFARSDVDSLSIGMTVVVYMASIRASARVVAGAVPDDEEPLSSSIASIQDTKEEDGFDFSFEAEENALEETKVPRMHVTFQFLNTREYLDADSQVFVMPGGGPGLYGHDRGERGVAGLDGFVGTIIGGY